MIDFKSVIPIIAVACTSMAFKETRLFGVLAIAALSYFYPVFFSVATMFGLGVGIYYFKYIRQGGRKR